MTTAEALEQLAAVRARCPELRFGQLLATIGMLAEDETGHGLWDVEDADFIAALERFSADLARRGAHPPEPGPTPDGRVAEAADSKPRQTQTSTGWPG